MQKAVVLLLVLLGCSLAHLNNLARNPNYREFVQWMKTTGQRYADEVELEQRYNNFLTAKARIAEKNAGDRYNTYALNQFSAMTAEEFKNYPCGSILRGSTAISTTDFAVSYKKTLPVAFDWTSEGVATNVKDQSIFSGSCGAYSAAATIEGVFAVAKGSNVILSEQQFIDCVDSKYPSAAMESAVVNGASEIDVYQPNNKIFSRSTCRQNTDSAAVTPVKVDVMCNGGAHCSEFDMAHVLFANGPLSVCFNASLLQDYSTGIINPAAGTCEAITNHCATIVGFGESSQGIKYWKVKNSWGQQWGENGYFRIARGTGACGINSIVSTVRF